MIKPLVLGVAVFHFIRQGAKGKRCRFGMSILYHLEKIPYKKNLLFNFILL